MVRFDRGGSLNALSQELLLELTEAATSLHDDPDVSAVVLTGTLQAFSAGIDLKDPARWEIDNLTLAEQRAVLARGQRLCRAWEAIPAVTVAAIEGMAIGGGVALALACDWRVIGQSAHLQLPEVRLGLNLGWQAIPRLTALIGPARAKRMAVLCERIDADRALQWGLVDEVADDGAAADRAIELAQQVAHMPSISVKMTKQSVNAIAYALNDLASYMDTDQALALRQSPDVRRAREAFNKR